LLAEIVKKDNGTNPSFGGSDMGLIAALVSIGLLIVLAIWLTKLAEAKRAVVDLEQTRTIPSSPRSEGELERLLVSMPKTWATYPGATPRLDLRIRGLTEELYRRFTRAYLDSDGVKQFVESLPLAQRIDAMRSHLPEIIARAYVTDWRGAQYPNGQPIPFDPQYLVAMMRKDEMLEVFITQQAKQLLNW
jgi:hypothetical protein